MVGPVSLFLGQSFNCSHLYSYCQAFVPGALFELEQTNRLVLGSVWLVFRSTLSKQKPPNQQAAGHLSAHCQTYNKSLWNFLRSWCKGKDVESQQFLGKDQFTSLSSERRREGGRYPCKDAVKSQIIPTPSDPESGQYACGDRRNRHIYFYMTCPVGKVFPTVYIFESD